MKKFIAIASASLLGLGLAACDSPAENAAENQVDAMEDNAEARVDAMEDSGAITGAQADAMEDQVEATADAQEDRIDAADPAGPASAAPSMAPTTAP